MTPYVLTETKVSLNNTNPTLSICVGGHYMLGFVHEDIVSENV